MKTVEFGVGGIESRASDADKNWELDLDRVLVGDEGAEERGGMGGGTRGAMKDESVRSSEG